MNKVIYKRKYLSNVLICLPFIIAILTAFCCGTYYLIFCIIKNATLPIAVFIISVICLFCILPLFIALIFFLGNLIKYPYIDKIKIENNCLIFKVITHFYKSKYINIPISEIKNININIDIAVPTGTNHYYDELTIRIDAIQQFEIKDYGGGGETLLLDSLLLYQDYLPDIIYKKNYKTNVNYIPYYNNNFARRLICAILLYAIFIPLIIYGVNIFLGAVK